jgi:cysteine/O-acetylserine efflux protein
MLQLIPFLSYVFVTTFTPGPNNIMAMSNANEHGFKKTQTFNLGVFGGFLIIMLLCSYLNLFLFSLLPRIKFFMEVLGAVYMLFLAFKIIKSAGKPGKNNVKGSNSFISGLVLQFINPKVILYGITVISNFIIPYYKDHISIILFCVFLAFIGYIATSCWAFLGNLFQKFLANYIKPFNMVMGLLLIYCSISIFF